MPGTKQSGQYILFEKGLAERRSAEIIVEASVSLTVNGEVWITFMCTPINLEDMAVGFLFNEGIIQSSDEIASMRVCASEANIDLWLSHSVEKPAQWRRTSGCTGGMTSVDTNSVSRAQPPGNNHQEVRITPEQLGSLIEALLDQQDLYRRSGGVHTSALSDGQELLVVAEDIGRHNTLDKIAGRCLREHIESSGSILVTTGRASSEMLQKAVRMGSAVLISRTSPSSLSIQIAEQAGITLVGYARRHSFRIYAHPERILGNQNPGS